MEFHYHDVDRDILQLYPGVDEARQAFDR